MNATMEGITFAIELSSDDCIRRHRQNWHEFYKRQGYSERESSILVEQICSSGYGSGNPRSGNFSMTRRTSAAQAEFIKYYTEAVKLSLREIRGAISEARNE